MQLLASLLLLAASATAQQCLTHPCPGGPLVCIGGACVNPGPPCPGCCPGCGLLPPPPCFLPPLAFLLCPAPPPPPQIPGIVQIAKRHEKDFTMKGPVDLPLEKREAELTAYHKIMEEAEANAKLDE